MMPTNVIDVTLVRSIH